MAALALALLAAGCGSAGVDASSTTSSVVPATGGTVTVGVDQAPTGCNPNTEAGRTEANLLALAPVLPSAFTVNDNGASVLNDNLLVSAELVDTSPQTVVYTIDPKAVWSDGTPITADDFIYAWQEQRGTFLNTQYPEGDEASTLGYRDIASMTPSDHARTVTVVFTSPFSDWQMLFANLLPAHVMSQVGWDPPCTTVDPAVDLSGGPFLITGVSDGGAVVTYARNPHWWGDKPYLDHLVLRTATGPDQLARWLVRGTAQVAYPASFDPAFLSAVSAHPTTSSEVDVSATFLSLEFNVTSPATADAGVRQAVAHEVDREALVTTVVGWADTAIVPSASHLYVQTQNGYPGPPPPPPNQGTTTSQPVGTPQAPFPLRNDPVTAARLFAAAGYTRGPGGSWTVPGGGPLTLRLVVDVGDAWAATTGDLVARQLERAGIGVTVVQAPTARAAGQILSTGAADLALVPRVTSPYPSRTSAWYTPTLGPAGSGGSQNWSNNDDPLVNQVFNQAVQELNPVTAQPSYDQADKQLWTTMVALPLFAEPTALGWATRTVGITPNPHGPALFWNVGEWGLRPPPTTTTAG